MFGIFRKARRSPSPRCVRGRAPKSAFRPRITALEDRTVPSTLDYSTFLGGNSLDDAFAVATDAAGNTYVTGTTASANFPATAGAVDGSLNGIYDAFVAKVRPDGTLAWATYLGGEGDERGHGIAVDVGGNVYVTGRTDSTNFPTTDGGLDTTLSGAVDAFVTKLSPDGTALVYSTYLGGTGNEIDQEFDKLSRRVGGIAVDSAGQAYVTGSTTSVNFPTTTGAFDTTGPGFIDAFVSKLNAAGSALVYSTYLGGDDTERGYDIAVDASGNAYVTGEVWSVNFPTTAGAFQPTLAGGGNDNFITKLNAAGSGLVYSSYLGGAQGEFPGRLAVDAAGQAYVTGATTSFDFPTTAGAFQTVRSPSGNPSRPWDGFVSKVNAAGSVLVYSTYLGGGFGNDYGEDIAVDGSGHAYVTGFAESATFPVANAFQPSRRGLNDAFVTKLNASGTALVYSSYLGGDNGGGSDTGYGIAVDGRNVAHVVGSTISSSSGFPTTASAFQPIGGGGRDAFVARIAAAPRVSSTVVNDGSAQRSRITSLQVTFNAIVTITGETASAFTFTRDSDGARVTFTATATVVNDVTVVTLNNFNGTATQFGSLADGRYTLTALAGQISANGFALDGDGDGQPGGDYHFGNAQGLFRFFGDINGDRHVDIADFGLFSASMFNPGNYNAAFDFNNDGHVDIQDFGQFSIRIFTLLP